VFTSNIAFQTDYVMTREDLIDQSNLNCEKIL